MVSESTSYKKVAIVCPTSSGNPVGRAISLFLVSKEMAETRIFLLADGNLWPGANDIRESVTPIKSESDLCDALDAFARQHYVALWHVKPFGPTLRWSESYVKKRKLRSILMVDVDDDDAGMISKQPRSAIERHKVSSRLKDGLPGRIRIRKSLSHINDHFRLSTSSHALEAHLGLPAALIIPHARPSLPRLAAPTNLDSAVFGFFGTLRPHKGLDFFKSFMRSSGRTSAFHFIEDSTTTREFKYFENVQLHRAVGIQELVKLYRLIDVVLLPQSDLNTGARFQFPAKLVDALQFRRIIISSATPPIIEWAGAAIERVDDWKNEDRVWNALESARRSRHDHEARVDAAFDHLTVESQISNVKSFLALD